MRLSQIQKSSRRKTASPCRIQIRERSVNWIKDSQLNHHLLCCSSVSGVFALTEGSPISDFAWMLRDREDLSGFTRIFAAPTPDYSALHVLTAGCVLESYLLEEYGTTCFFTASKNTSLRSLPGGREFVATGGGDSRGGCMFEKGGAGFSWACSFDAQSALHEKSDNHSCYETKPLISPILDSNAQVHIDTILLYAVYRSL